MVKSIIIKLTRIWRHYSKSKNAKMKLIRILVFPIVIHAVEWIKKRDRRFLLIRTEHHRKTEQNGTQISIEILLPHYAPTVRKNWWYREISNEDHPEDGYHHAMLNRL